MGLRSATMDAEENERPAVEAGRSRAGLGGVNAVRARALRALLDLELDLLSAGQAVEVERGVEAAAMEEVLLRIVRGDEAEAAIGDDLLDGTGGHIDLQHFSNKEGRSHGPFEKGSTTRSIVAQRGEGQV
jgi:hypothetical protein